MTTTNKHLPPNRNEKRSWLRVSRGDRSVHRSHLQTHPATGTQAPLSATSVTGGRGHGRRVDLMGGPDRGQRIDLMGGPDRGQRIDLMGGPDRGQRIDLMGGRSLRLDRVGGRGRGSIDASSTTQTTGVGAR